MLARERGADVELSERTVNQREKDYRKGVQEIGNKKR
jgi:hypothetical protein